VELKLGHCDQALDYAQRFSSSVGPDGTAAVAQAENWVRHVQGECPDVEIKSDPAGASLVLDHAPTIAGVTPWKGHLPTGSHSVSLRLGVVETQKVVIVQVGVPYRLSVPLGPAPSEELPPIPSPEAAMPIAPPPVAPEPPALTPAQPAPTPSPLLSLPATPAPTPATPPVNLTAVKAPPAPAPATRMPPVRVIGWSALAVGGAALVAGLVLGLGVRSDTAALEKVNASRSGGAAQQAINSINARAIGTDVLLGAGGAFAATGGAIVIAF
jgi:hypothetical protein